MADDRSLDEFLDAENDNSEDDIDEGASSAEPGTPAGGDAPKPAQSTVAFDPDGAACEACGATVQRRWRDDGALVCGDCKEW